MSNHQNGECQIAENQSSEKIIGIGPIEATRTETKTLPFPPIAGAIAIIAGVVLLVRRPGHGV